MIEPLTRAQLDVIDALWDSFPRDPENRDRRSTPWGRKTKAGLMLALMQIMKPVMAEELARYFPWLLDENADPDGTDTVNQLDSLYRAWRAK